MTLDLGKLVPKDDETIYFCPVENKPIAAEDRARTLPGFHLLSISAAQEAVRTGSYNAYGADHKVEDFEVLHPDDELFISI